MTNPNEIKQNFCRCCGVDALKPKNGKWKKTVVMYCTMVAVSTIAICWLEHASCLNAFRTALVAAVGKTIAATWVSEWFA